MNLKHWANKLEVPGHKGPHPKEYHEAILNILEDAVASASIEGIAAEIAEEIVQDAIENALLKVASRLCSGNDPLLRLISP